MESFVAACVVFLILHSCYAVELDLRVFTRKHILFSFYWSKLKRYISLICMFYCILWSRDGGIWYRYQYIHTTYDTKDIPLTLTIYLCNCTYVRTWIWNTNKYFFRKMGFCVEALLFIWQLRVKGGQIGLIFTHWVIVTFGQVFVNYTRSPHFWQLLSTVTAMNSFWPIYIYIWLQGKTSTDKTSTDKTSTDIRSTDKRSTDKRSTGTKYRQTKGRQTKRRQVQKIEITKRSK
jgi:hypothetical protein